MSITHKLRKKKTENYVTAGERERRHLACIKKGKPPPVQEKKGKRERVLSARGGKGGAVVLITKWKRVSTKVVRKKKEETATKNSRNGWLGLLSRESVSLPKKQLLHTC